MDKRGSTWHRYGGLCVAAFMVASTAQANEVTSITTLVDHAGRVDWCASNNKIAFDQSGADNYFQVHTINPDGSNDQCITCGKSELPARSKGNPTWQPSGNYIVFQAQIDFDSPMLPKPLLDYIAAPGGGFMNNLWATDADGSHFWRLTDVPRGSGVLHPHFSHSGDKLLWAQRIGRDPTLGEMWAIKLADFVVENGTPQLRNIQTYRPGEQKAFYETHGFSPDDRKIIFCANMTPGQSQLKMDIQLMDLQTGEVQNLTNSMDEWDEMAEISPSGRKIVWMTSKGYPSPDRAGSPHATEYWMMNIDGSDKHRLTYFNEPGHPEYMGHLATAADDSWNADGTRLVAYVIDQWRPVSEGKIVIINFDSPQ